MAAFKDNQNGFSIVEILMLAVIIALIGSAGLLVYKNHTNNSPKNPVLFKTSSSGEIESGLSGPNSSQYAGWIPFCSNYGGLCLKYPSNWKFSQVTYTPGQNTNGQEVDTITSPSTNVTVSYMPSSQVTGARRDEAIKVVGVSGTAENDLEVVKLIDQVSGQPIQYAVEDFVTLASAAHALNAADSRFTQGATIQAISEPPFHQFTSPNRPSNIGQQLLAVTISNGNAGNNVFSSNTAAQAWLNSAEVQTAGQILSSVTYSQ